jgi:hypothetical protein
MQLKNKWIFVLLLVLAFGTPVYLLPAKIDNPTWEAQVYNNMLAMTAKFGKRINL